MLLQRAAFILWSLLFFASALFDLKDLRKAARRKARGFSVEEQQVTS
jgi:hypothetical protein